MSLKDTAGFESLNVIPMIDVMLVLLTIVLTTASFIATGRIPLELPEASQTPRDGENDSLLVEIDARGQIHLAGEALSLAALEGKLAGVPRESPVLLRADRNVRFQSAVDVLDLLKSMHFRKLAIQTGTRYAGR
jgi:biopolymer transport protein ExbD